MGGLELGIEAARRLEQPAQPGGVEDATAVERIEDRGLSAALDTDQEVSGKAEPRGAPPLCPGGVQVQDPERHRQPLAPIDDPGQVGVVEIIVGLGIAAIPEGAENDVVERLDAAAERGAGGMPDRHRDLRKVPTIGGRTWGAGAERR